jgi:hypothetical protein
MGWSWAQSANIEEQQILPWAKRAAIAFPLLGVATALINLATSSSWARYFHAFRLLIDNPRIRSQLPPPRTPEWTLVLVPLSLLVQILFVVWQYRAAVTAQRLRYPARRSPALGVGSYLIPVVQFWFPYQALRDCLPPGDPNRTMVLKTWLLLILTGIISFVLVYFLAETHGLGVGLLVVQIGLETWLASLGYRVVSAISAAHDTALANR